MSARVSEAQARMLNVGRNAHPYGFYLAMGENRTVWGLVNRGLLATGEEGGTFRITDKGLKALKPSLTTTTNGVTD